MTCYCRSQDCWRNLHLHQARRCFFQPVFFRTVEKGTRKNNWNRFSFSFWFEV